MTGHNHALLEEAFHRGAEDGSAALAKWLGRPVSLSVDRLDMLPIASAASVLGSGDEPVCGCAMGISGAVGGLLLLAAEDVAALSLADTLLEQAAGRRGRLQARGKLVGHGLRDPTRRWAQPSQAWKNSPLQATIASGAPAVCSRSKSSASARKA